MTDGPVDWVEENIDDPNVIDVDARPQDYFKNWWAFAEGTKRDILDLFDRARSLDWEETPVEEKIREAMRSFFDPLLRWFRE